MKEALRKLALSEKHLKLIDEFLLRNDGEYRRMERKLNQMGDDYLDFCRELYFGGNKSRGNEPRGSRQMILSDIFQYMLTSRAYYLAAKSEEHRKKFVKISMYLINQWLIMDCLGPRETLTLRRALMDRLSSQIGVDFFEEQDQYHTQRFKETYDYEGDLIPKPPNLNPPKSSVLATYDSLFPKIRGGPIEVLVYLYLLQRRLGFVVSLLIQQRLLSGNRVLRPPDLFLLRSKGEIIGLEIGRGKEKQSADFSLLTSIPTFSIDLVERQPFRCDGCGRWIIYCDQVIHLYSDQGVPEDNVHTLLCVDCPNFDSGHCPDIICYASGTNRYGKERSARYHLRCVPQSAREGILRDVDKYKEDLVSYYPLVEGLETLSEE